MADTVLAPADSQSAVLPGETGTSALVKHVAQKLLELDREIKDLDKRIVTLFREHPSAVIIEWIAGTGSGLGAEFLVVSEGDMATFVTGGRLVSFAALVSVPRDLGKVSGNLRRPKRYNRRLRRVFYLVVLFRL